MTNISKIKRNIKSIFLALALVFFAQILFGTSAVSAQYLRSRVVNTSNFTEQVAFDSSRLPYEVKYRLLTIKEYTVFDWLEASADANGNVVLRGQVTNAATKAKAAAIVAQVEGVNKISNQIEVLPASDSDSKLRKSLYRAIYNQNTALARYIIGSVPAIHIVVKNNIVTLYGTVDNKIDGEMAFVAANSVPVVSGVNNKLQTSNNLTASLNRTSKVIRQ